jgi:hypothetical protein
LDRSPRTIETTEMVLRTDPFLDGSVMLGNKIGRHQTLKDMMGVSGVAEAARARKTKSNN